MRDFVELIKCQFFVEKNIIETKRKGQIQKGKNGQLHKERVGVHMGEV